MSFSSEIQKPSLRIHLGISAKSAKPSATALTFCTQGTFVYMLKRSVWSYAESSVPSLHWAESGQGKGILTS